MEPLELLYETPGLPAFPLPDELARLYGGTLGFEEPRVFANFVQTIDGVTAIPSVAGSNKLIAGGNAADRFVMGLLRAVADVVVVGSGRSGPRHAGRGPQPVPFDAGEELAELRRRSAATATGTGRAEPKRPRGHESPGLCLGRGRLHDRRGSRPARPPSGADCRRRRRP
jgi:hypothetical protein